MNWQEFWNSENTIYVSPRHIEENYKAIAESVLAHLEPGSRLLDFGCGYALSTDAFVKDGHTIVLYDPTPKMRDFVTTKYGKDSRVHIVDSVESIPENSLDAVLVHSVLQYMKKEDIEKLLHVFSTKLRRDGMLILSDLVPPHVNPIHDVLALLKIAISRGFFFATCVSLVRTFFSNYRAIREKEGFSTFTQEEVIAMLRKAGFSGKGIPNIGLLHYRMAVLGTRL